MGFSNGAGGPSLPTWWPIATFTLGAFWGTLVLILRIDMPAFYPIIGLLVTSGPAAYADRFLRRKSENGNGNGS